MVYEEISSRNYDSYSSFYFKKIKIGCPPLQFKLSHSPNTYWGPYIILLSGDHNIILLLGDHVPRVIMQWDTQSAASPKQRQIFNKIPATGGSQVSRYVVFTTW